MDKYCDLDEAFTRKEMYEESDACIYCRVNPECPYHIKIFGKSKRKFVGKEQSDAK